MAESSSSSSLDRGLPSKKTIRGVTTMRELTHIKSEGERLVVRYNAEGQPIGPNAKKIQSYIGVCVRNHIPISYPSWKNVPEDLKDKLFTCIEMSFAVDACAKNHILLSASKKFRTFKYSLTQKYILPFKDQPSIICAPPKLYSFIDQAHWDAFVQARLSEEFKEIRLSQQKRRAQNIDNHRISRKRCANLAIEMDSLTETKRKNDLLTEALGTPEHRGCVKGVGVDVDVTPTTSVGSASDHRDSTNGTPGAYLLGRTRCSIPQARASSDTLLSIENAPPKKSKEKLYPPLVRLLYLYARTVMKDDETIRVDIPTEIFSRNRINYLMKEDVLQFCGMLEITTPCITTYIAYLWSRFHDKDVLRRVKFVDPSIIAANVGTQDDQIETLLSILETVQPMQLVIIPYNTGGHWVLIVMDPYKNMLYSLDPLRKGIRGDIKIIGDMAMALFAARKAIEVGKMTRWKTLTCPRQPGSVECGYYILKYIRHIMDNSSTPIRDLFTTKAEYTQPEIDEMRVEWADYVGSFIRV